MNFKPDDLVKYTYADYIYILRVVELSREDDEFCKCLFLANIGDPPFYYKYQEIQKFPKKYMRKLTKLEQALQ